MDIKSLFNLAGKDGKVVIIGENGEVRGVFLAGSQAFSDAGQISSQNSKNTDPEKVNREILEAQLKDNVALDGNLETISGEIKMPEPISQVLQQRAKSLFVSKDAAVTYQATNDPDYSPIEETFHPLSQNISRRQFQDTSSEEIRPNFDDI